MNRNVIGLFTCLCLCGCGTLYNVAPHGAAETRVYGGVREDLQTTKESFQGAARATNLGEFAGNAGMGVLSVVDLPLSAIGDTVTLPITVKHAAQ
jgi:uncharacterized protein YceK